jgi:hypothetical protein
VHRGATFGAASAGLWREVVDAAQQWECRALDERLEGGCQGPRLVVATLRQPRARERNPRQRVRTKLGGGGGHRSRKPFSDGPIAGKFQTVNGPPDRSVEDKWRPGPVNLQRRTSPAFVDGSMWH